ncbi:hypothetical protein K456DRAFT_381974 [Colletotrichum gloeosporioides 23]|nr:hypothetical protein K456DRAFT_381974 [Colletotrichum gloeosporioides 23]
MVSCGRHVQCGSFDLLAQTSRPSTLKVRNSANHSIVSNFLVSNILGSSRRLTGELAGVSKVLQAGFRIYSTVARCRGSLFQAQRSDQDNTATSVAIRLHSHARPLTGATQSFNRRKRNSAQCRRHRLSFGEDTLHDAEVGHPPGADRAQHWARLPNSAYGSFRKEWPVSVNTRILRRRRWRPMPPMFYPVGRRTCRDLNRANDAFLRNFDYTYFHS